MTEFPISSQVSWVDHYIQQKLYLSEVVEKVRIHSGDGFTFTLPRHALVASSKLIQTMFLSGEKDQDILLPSVRGRTLIPLVELLRRGIATITGKIGDMNTESIK